MSSVALAWHRVLRMHPIQLVGRESIYQRCATNATNSATLEQRYGEVTAAGLKELVRKWPDVCAIEKHSVVYDIGAGFGRLGAYLRLFTNASRIRGIEVNECRHWHSKALLKTVRRVQPSTTGALNFALGDVRDLGFSDATHVLLAAQTWGAELLTDIFRQALAAPRLRCVVVVSRRLPRGWTEAVSVLASSFGHAVAVNYLPTTYVSASAIFFRRGPCIETEEQPATRPLRRQRGARMCLSTRELARATQMQGMGSFGGRVW